MDLDASVLSRLHPAAAVHGVLTSFTIGLATWLAVVEGLWLGTANETFRQLYRRWIPVFAIVFGAAVVSALRTPPRGRLELGLSITAFVLEAGLLAAMTFGWPPGARRSHFACTVALALGSVVFVLAWPRAPALTLDELGRLLLAAYLATAVLIGAAAAWRLMRAPDPMTAPDQDPACMALKMAIGMFVIYAPLQLAIEAGRIGAPVRLLPLLAGLVLAVGLWGGALARRNALERSRPFLAACVLLAPVSPLAAAAAWAVPDAGL